MPKRTVITCPNCRTQSPFTVETVIDASRDPDAKVRLLSGRINSFRCPACGAPINLSAPILYHDPAHELLMAYVPMELNLGKDGEQRMLGELMNELNTLIPRDQFKGYMFQPKQTLSMQGLIDAVLQADGVTPEMMASHAEGVFEKIHDLILCRGPLNFLGEARIRKDEVRDVYSDDEYAKLCSVKAAVDPTNRFPFAGVGLRD